MKCRKCGNEFTEADKTLDAKRLTSACGPPPPKHFLPYSTVLGYGIGEFAPLCVKCFYAPVAEID